jgi:non-specific serine/threonine protein kinase
VGNSTKISTDALLDFSVAVTFDGQPLDEKELRAIFESSGGLVALKGKWVELDRDRLAEALKHWKNVERTAQHRGISFFEGMRMLSGANLQGDAASLVPEAAKEWVGISAGQHLEKVLQELRHPERAPDPAPPGIRTDLRPYQQIGVHWLRFMTRLGLGPCLADDMGLGKTIQVLALLLHLKHDSTQRENPSLLIVPASLIANWKAEISRFAPSLSIFIAHPSETNGEGKASVMLLQCRGVGAEPAADGAGCSRTGSWMLSIARRRTFSSRSRSHSACAVFTRSSSSCWSLIERLVRINFAEHMLPSEQEHGHKSLRPSFSMSS